MDTNNVRFDSYFRIVSFSLVKNNPNLIYRISIKIIQHVFKLLLTCLKIELFYFVNLDNICKLRAMLNETPALSSVKLKMLN